MGVQGVIGGANQVRRNGPSEQDGENIVLNRVVLALVKGEQEESVVPEVGVVHQTGHEPTQPGRGKGDVGIMTIVGHVRRDERPLRKLLVIQVGVEVGEVLDLSERGGIARDGVEKDQGIVLAHVFVGERLLVGVVEALETGIGNALLIFAPGDVLGVQEVGHGRDVGRKLPEVIVVHAIVVAAGRRAVVGFGRVTGRPVVGQFNALTGQPLLVGVARSGAVVLYR